MPRTWNPCGKCVDGFVLSRDEAGRTWSTRCTCRPQHGKKPKGKKSELACGCWLPDGKTHPENCTL